MPLSFPTGPASGPAVVESELRKILHSAAGGAMLSGQQAAVPTLNDPHQTYFVGLDDLLKGKLLSAAQPVAWRYLVNYDNKAVAEAEVSIEESSKKPKFLALYEGPFAAASEKAIQAAEKLAKVKKAEYEVRYLKIPAVYFAAVWLHGDKADWIMPINNPPAKLKENHLYTEAQIISALSKTADESREFDRKLSNRKSP